MVLVCHPHRFVFLKTRKTAGTSVEMVLEPLCRAPGHEVTEKTRAAFTPNGIVGARAVPVSSLHWWEFRQHRWRHHMGASDVRRRIGRRRFDSYRKISCVRDPFDRAVSTFHWINRTAPPPVDFAEVRARFRAFVLADDWPTDEDVTFADGVCVVDFAVRFEHMRADLVRLAEEMELPLDPNSVPHTKDLGRARGGRPVAEYFDVDTIEVVRRRMAWVFDRHGYADTPGDGVREAAE